MNGTVSNDKKTGEWKLYKKNGELAGTYFPLYEDAQPVFLTAETIKETGAFREKYSKPEYRFKSRQPRYFTPVVNEYKGVVFSTNPLALAIGKLPFALEYYIQERLGYELTYTLNKNPFFVDQNNVVLNEPASKGNTISIKQKFYSSDKSIGMLYFSHEIGFENATHSVNTVDLLNPNPEAIAMVQSTEYRYHYGITVGSRLIRDPGNAGLTMDVFAGIGIGMRSYTKKYAEVSYDQYFTDLNQSKTYVPIIFGLTFGYLGTKKKEYYP
jgi:hypothetical protein